MDRSVDPHEDFYHYADGTWVRENPVPDDKSSWGGFEELREWNLQKVRDILERAAEPTPSRSPEERLVGDFYASGMDTSTIEARGLTPLVPGLRRLERVSTVPEVVQALGELHRIGLGPLFSIYSDSDKKDSATYALYLQQAELSLPDRDYYLKDDFRAIRESYQEHLTRMFQLLGDPLPSAEESASVVLELETELAKASRSRVELRDEEKNYHRVPWNELESRFALGGWEPYLKFLEFPPVPFVVVGQPEFFESAARALSEHPVAHWRTYLRWSLLHSAAPYLSSVLEQEDFQFFHKTLLGQAVPEARWKRVASVVDRNVGEALGKLYVDLHFPPEARERMRVLVEDIKTVFRERLESLPWMQPSTREKALAKFARFVTKIGHPERFRDYSSLRIDRTDFLGNLQRSGEFEMLRLSHRTGGPVDRSEWRMTPPTVNAYFSPTENEIVFPAGILQPPFFDAEADDAVNYGGIGGVIGHEITHGYDDQGRRYDRDGNLVDWWTPEDAREFQSRAQEVVDLYSSQKVGPGLSVNGELTLGENIADLGGVSLAFEALQRRLARTGDRALRDGLTPEQRFYISWAQVWRSNFREPEIRRRLTIDPHSPASVRASVPPTQHVGFDRAFARPAGSPPIEHRRMHPIW
jgi:predicted metalloendopeptidase